MHLTQRNLTQRRSIDVAPPHEDELSPLSPQSASRVSEGVGVPRDRAGVASASTATTASFGGIAYDTELDKKVNALFEEKNRKFAEVVDTYLCVGHPALKQKRTFWMVHLYAVFVPADERKLALIALAEMFMVVSGLFLALTPMFTTEYADPADPSYFELLQTLFLYVSIYCLFFSILGGLCLLFMANSIGAAHNNVGDLRSVALLAIVANLAFIGGMWLLLFGVAFMKIMHQGFISARNDEEFYISGIASLTLIIALNTVFATAIVLPFWSIQGLSLMMFHMQCLWRLTPLVFLYWYIDVKTEAVISGMIYRKRIKASCPDIHEVMLEYSKFPELYR